MALNPTELYTIIGEEAHLVGQVRTAMEWLLSPRAEGLGQKLLEDAHELHGKPVTIHVTSEIQSQYENTENIHTVFINPLERTAHVTADGGKFISSMESSLAHELTHAGQSAAKNPSFDSDTILKAVEAKVNSEYHPKDAAWMAVLKARYASSREAVLQHVAGFVDKTLLPAEYRMKELMLNDPRFQHIIETIENPAIANENRVAQLRGEPQRGVYLALDHATSQERNETVAEWARIVQADKKPRQHVSWEDRVKNSEGQQSKINTTVTWDL